MNARLARNRAKTGNGKQSRSEDEATTRLVYLFRALACLTR